MSTVPHESETQVFKVYHRTVNSKSADLTVIGSLLGLPDVQNDDNAGITL
jgi:hypothetical protein